MSVDGSLYLLLGSHLISGESYTVFGDVLTIRGPVLPGLLGGLMLVFGRDVESLAWTIRLLVLINPVLVYFLMKRISGPVTGLLAAAVVTLCGYTAMSWRADSLDAFQLTIYLLAILVLLIGAQENRAGLSLLSGLLLGVAILTKETSVVALPLAPFAALLFKSSFRGVLLHYAGVTTVCLPWWIWLWAVSGEVFLLGALPSGLVVPVTVALALVALLTIGAYRLGMFARLLANEQRQRWVGWSVVLVPTVVLSFLLLAKSGGMVGNEVAATTYFTQTLLKPTPLWYLLPLAGAYALLEAARGDRFWGFYSALLIIQIPVALLVVVERFATRQWLIPQTLLYGALAGLVMKIIVNLMREEGYNLRRLLTFGAATVLIVVLVHATVLQVRSLLFDDANLRGYINDDNSAVYDMHAYIAGNIPEEEKVTTTLHNSFYLTFLDGTQHEWTRLEVDCSVRFASAQDPNNLTLPPHCLPDEETAQAPPQPTVWFKMDENCSGLALPLATLMQQIERSDSTYLLATQQNALSSPSGLAWASYLDSSGAFETVHSSYVSDALTGEQSYGLVLLKRTGRDPAPVPTRMDTRTVTTLIACERRTQGEQYAEAIKSKFPNGIEVTVGSGNPAETESVRAKMEQIYDTGQ